MKGSNMKDQTYAELYARKKEAGELKRIAPKLLKFEEGVTIVGSYVGREVVPSKNENIPDSYRYIVDTDEGLVSFFTSNAFDKSQGALLKEGNVYAFENRGKVPWKENQSMWDIACYLLEGTTEGLRENGDE